MSFSVFPIVLFSLAVAGLVVILYQISPVLLVGIVSIGFATMVYKVL